MSKLYRSAPPIFLNTESGFDNYIKLYKPLTNAYNYSKDLWTPVLYDKSVIINKHNRSLPALTLRPQQEKTNLSVSSPAPVFTDLYKGYHAYSFSQNSKHLVNTYGLQLLNQVSSSPAVNLKEYSRYAFNIKNIKNLAAGRLIFFAARLYFKSRRMSLLDSCYISHSAPDLRHSSSPSPYGGGGGDALIF